jgi:hypothetical protein
LLCFAVTRGTMQPRRATSAVDRGRNHRAERPVGQLRAIFDVYGSGQHQHALDQLSVFLAQFNALERDLIEGDAKKSPSSALVTEMTTCGVTTLLTARLTRPGLARSIDLVMTTREHVLAPTACE